jgi:CheY-like chemotaxis protein
MILVVDDFADGGAVLCRLLSRKGYPCEYVSDGATALTKMRTHPPEQPLLVVLDEMMPGMNGMEVLHHIRADPPISHSTVIMYSAGFDAAKRDLAITLGVVAWLYKGGNAAADEIGNWYERVGGAKQQQPTK